VLTAKKKLSSREITPKTTVATIYYDAQEWIRKNSKLVGGIVLGVVAIIIIGYLYVSGKAADDREANRQLRLVQELYQQQQYKMAIMGDPNRGIPGLEEIVTKYGGTPTGEIAAVFLGNSYLYSGEYDKALDTFERASPKADVLRAASVAGQAAVYEAKEDFARAAKLYERAAGMIDNDLLTSERHLAAGRAYALAGDKAKAKRLLEKVKESKSTRFHVDADRLLAKFGLIEY